MDQLGGLAPGTPGHPQVGLAQPDPVPPGQPRQDVDSTLQQFVVGRVRHRLGLDGGVDGHPPPDQLAAEADEGGPLGRGLVGGEAAKATEAGAIVQRFGQLDIGQVVPARQQQAAEEG
ncbi:hypothetical protein GCM10011504_56350 [Siccirubricoccus deserti]|uniref:Uncharacterized protein n=1 Tax=Siccirubricoccus deserti TaxID=2013562 RepID=A0A9X0UK72_9PROT|nr:hypothetical protein [Siccirubricoccus deserti]MBC4018865.1 hypothetical protein [Siccirubricoccus deserti]GGC71396.1 hypothetical protein GCM10011504_56350 [Siccirubricoccus deserti]